jgi:VIT1/CCC1 family predicted Fe2+/Mn2+ transporter
MEKREKGEELTHRINEADLFRTKVFGIQDGLIGVGAIVLGAAGFSHQSLAVLVAGLIATIAQAFSMGVGEYISTRVRMQVIQAEIGKERYQIDHFPEMEREELVQFYLRKGFRREAAERIADFLMGNKDVVLQEMLMNELRVFPEEFQSPVKLGIVMALYLILGGILPVIPFGISWALPALGFRYATLASVALVLITLALFGSLGTRYTGLSKARGAMEQVGTGLLALSGSYVSGLILAHFLPSTLLP